MRYLLLILLLSLPAFVFASAGGGASHGPPAHLFKFFFNFSLLIGILVYFTKDSVRELFKNRYEEFNEKSMAAVKQKEALDAEKKDLNKRLKEIRENKETSIKKAQEESQNMYNKELAEAETTAAKIISDADGQVDGDSRKMIETLRLEALELSVASAEKEMQGLDGAAKQKLNDEFKTRVEKVAL